jgi:hypothetical protein
LKKKLEDPKTSHIHGLAELIFWKWLYNWKKTMYLMKSLSKSQWHHRNRKSSPKIHMETQKIQKSQRNTEQKSNI